MSGVEIARLLVGVGLVVMFMPLWLLLAGLWWQLCQEVWRTWLK